MSVGGSALHAVLKVKRLSTTVENRCEFLDVQKREKAILSDSLFALNRSLAMTYSHMGNPHTTIGAVSFHC